jgi:CubicO group peptidase (beta-lactamase class C family)
MTAPRTDPESFESIWRLLDSHVATGRFPGYVAGVRVRGRVEIRAGGRTAIDADSAPMTENTLFRIASVTKPIGGALTLSLIQDGLLDLDDPIARWLPETEHPRVLVTPDAPLHHTIPASRPITLRHLLTLTCGWGAILEASPLHAAMTHLGVYPGHLPPPMSADEFVARVSELPLAFQPGEGWLYDTGIDLLGVLLSQATGKPLSDLVAERIAAPLNMTSTGFWAGDSTRLATAYQPGPDGLETLDRPDGAFAQPPPFLQLGSGLVTSAPDLLNFFCAMADGGSPVLTNESVAVMTTDALNADQRRQARPILGPGVSWALATCVDVEMVAPWMAPGRWGWDGASGTTARVDPARDRVAVLLTQRAMAGPADRFDDFWAAVGATP